MERLRASQRRRSDERFAERFAHQWAQLRAERRPEEPPAIEPGESNFAQAKVPHGVDLAAAWGWRFLVIVAAGYVILRGVALFEVVMLPLVIALLFAALLVPLVGLLHRAGFPRGLASILVEAGGLGLVVVLLIVAGQQIATGATDLAKQVADGIAQINEWLKNGPLHASESQINTWLRQAQDAVTSGNQQMVTRVTEVGTALSHIVAGFFIVLFATYFFLADGARIWAWMVRLFPRASRAKADSSGRVAWLSLTKFVRATVLVAFTDALGVMLVAAILKVPFVFAIGVLVFIGAFIPMIGALLSGTVAVLVALVAHGPVVALIMLGGVVAVQQIEAHVLQPFLMGRFVAVHPLGVIVAIACGVLVAGIPGALVAVPLVAALNAVVLHLADLSNGGVAPPGVPPAEGTPQTGPASGGGAPAAGGAPAPERAPATRGAPTAGENPRTGQGPAVPPKTGPTGP
jgi:predicted PurR-regulated permease PerM